jgi:hypothetical protein
MLNKNYHSQEITHSGIGGTIPMWFIHMVITIHYMFIRMDRGLKMRQNIPPPHPNIKHNCGRHLKRINDQRRN